MDQLWNYFKSLFDKAEASSPSQPLVHELIERTEEEKEDYAHWKRTLVPRRLLDWLQDQYAIYQVLPADVDEGIDFLNTPSSKGFVIHLHQTRYSRRDAVYMLDYLKERVKAQGYRSQISDTRSYQRANWAETVQRHYLKPGPTFKSAPVPGQKLAQKYGNIMIELELRNDKAHNLRLRATSYKDHLYEEAKAFKGLMGVLTAAE